MALSVVLAATGSDGTDGSTFSIPSVTLSSGKLYLLGLLPSRGDSTTPPTVSSVTGTSTTFSSVADAYFDAGSAARGRMSVWAVTGSGVTTALGVTLSATATALNWTLLEFSGFKGPNPSDAIIQSVTSDNGGSTTGTSCTINLAAFASTVNMGVGFLAHATAEAHNPGSWTELSDLAAQSYGYSTQYKVNDTACSFSWASGNRAGGVALEIAQQVGLSLSGSITPTGTLSRKTLKSLAGSITPTGTFSYIKSQTLALAGSITPSGQVVFKTFKSLAGSITPSGVVSMLRIHKHLSALASGTKNLVALAASTLHLTARPADSVSASLALTALDEEDA